jgi:xanthine dehydrogenase accessory factor
MGSSQRWKVVKGQLTELGMKTEELERIATPIGIEIAAESPEEIAVSILAEVIAGDNIS